MSQQQVFFTVVQLSPENATSWFFTEIAGNVIPVEVKAGFNTKAKSLQAFINKYLPGYAIKFTGNKFGYDRQKMIYNYPLYMISRFPALCLHSGLGKGG
ncbi:MAG: succinyl-diaminopimelate desuccinylase [Deltaproteobacteria bacterium]|nr:succinyl-diaminopimelate desuccinylase [Deltaproteobacteria bacterium]